MTTMVLHYSTNLLENILKMIRNTFLTIMVGWRNARQRSVNRHVAEQLIRHAKSDYQYHTIDSLAAELDKKAGI